MNEQINQAAVDHFLASIPADAPREHLQRAAEMMDRRLANPTGEMPMFQGQRISAATLSVVRDALVARLS